MQFKTFVSQINSSATSVVLYQPTVPATIKNLALVFINDSNTAYVNIKITDPDGNSGYYAYNMPVTKDGIYIDNLFLEPGSKVTIEFNQNYTPADTDVVNIVAQVVELA